MLDLKFLLLKSYKDQRLKFVKKWQTKTIPPIPDLRCQSMVRVKFWTVIGKNSKGKDMVRGEYIQCSWNQLCDVTSLWYIPHRRRGGGLSDATVPKQVISRYTLWNMWIFYILSQNLCFATFYNNKNNPHLPIKSKTKKPNDIFP